MSTMKERAEALLDTRARVHAESQGFLEDLKGQEMSEAEKAQWDKYNERIDALGAEADELMTRETNEIEAGKVREAQSAAYGRGPEAGEMSMNQRLAKWAGGASGDENPFPNGLHTNIEGVRRERDLIRQGASPDEIRALVWDTGSDASVVPTEFDRNLYEVLEASIAALRMPVRRLITNTGANIELPVNDAHSIATQVSGQGTTLAGTDPTFTNADLTVTKFAQLIRASAELIEDNGVNLASFLATDIGRGVGRRVDEQIIDAMIGAVTVGNGGTVSTGGSLITPTYEHLINLLYSVNDGYRSSNSTGWLGLDSTAGTLRKLRDGAGGTEGSPIWQPSVVTGITGQRQPDFLLGHPMYTDPNVAALASNAKVLFFGDWNSFVFRSVGSGPIVDRSDVAGFTTDDVLFRGKWRTGGAYVDLTGVNLLKQSV